MLHDDDTMLVEVGLDVTVNVSAVIVDTLAVGMAAAIF